MPKPYNYMLNLPNPSQNLLDTVSFGLKARAVQQDMETQQAAAQRQQQFQTDASAVLRNPNPQAILGLMTRYPESAKELQSVYQSASMEQRDADVRHASQVYAALQANQPDVARQLLEERAIAQRNSGMEDDAKASETFAQLISASPKTAQAISGMLVASADPDSFAETFGKLQSERRAAELQPAKMTEAQAKAHKAAVEAKFAESSAVAELASKGWDASAMITDPTIRAQNSRLAALSAQAARTTKDLQRQELEGKIQDAQAKRDQAVRDKAAAAETIISTSDNQIATIDRLLANPGLNDVTGPIAGSEYYPSVAAGYTVAGFVFGSSPGQRAEALADLETVKSQVFMNAIVQLKQAGNGSTGLGPTSDREGERLVTSRQSLDPRQPTASIIRNLRTIRDMQKRYKDAVVKKFGAPEGVPTPAEPETPAAAPQAAPTAGADIQDLLRRHGTVQ